MDNDGDVRFVALRLARARSEFIAGMVYLSIKYQLNEH